MDGFDDGIYDPAPLARERHPASRGAGVETGREGELTDVIPQVGS